MLRDVKKNSRDDSVRNLYFDRTTLVDNYYAMLPGRTDPVLYMSMSAASPGVSVDR